MGIPFIKLVHRDRGLTAKLIFCAGLALFWVVFLWHFWERGIFALGINAAAFLGLLLWLFVWVLWEKGYYTKSDLTWIVPIALIAASYALYDNPFLKITNFLVLPIGLAVFYNQAYLRDKMTTLWDRAFMTRIIGRLFSFFATLPAACIGYLHLIIPAGTTKNQVIIRIVIGVVLFLIVALTVVVPLLSSADAVFAAKVQYLYEQLQKIISLPFIYKLLVFIVLSILCSSVLLAWGREFAYTEKDTQTTLDPIVTGIVLSGILGIYVLFLWVQVSRLWVGALPFDFKETESIVKSGFWQLLFLSVLNIVIYFFTYRKTNLLVQRVLAVFTITSLFLLASAGYRMGLYATYYGLSYEKFFASYTVLYCAILFVWLIWRLFARERSNIVKFVVLLFLWMYAAITVFPVEQSIIRANIALSHLEGSRIRLFEMTMLSPDVLGLVKEYRQQDRLKEKVGYLARERIDNSEKLEFDWGPWIERQEARVSSKAWYERNLINSITSVRLKIQ